MKHIKVKESVINIKAIKEVEKSIELFGEKYMINAFKENKLKGEKFENQQQFIGFEHLDTLSFTQFFAIINKNYIIEESFEEVLSNKYAIYLNELKFNNKNDDFIHRKNGFTKVCQILQKYNVSLDFLTESNGKTKKVLIREKLANAIEDFIKNYSVEHLIYVFEMHKMENKKFSAANNHLYYKLIDLDNMDFNDFFKLVNGRYEVIEELSDSLESLYLSYKENSDKKEIISEKEGFMDACKIMQKYGYRLQFLSENN